MSVSGLGNTASQLMPLDWSISQEELKKAKGNIPQASFLTALKGAEKPRDAASASDIFAGMAQGDTGNNTGTQKLEKSAEEKFLDYSKLSDVEKLHMKELKEKDLSEEKLNEMAAEQRQALEEGIRAKLEETVRQQTGKSVGGIADITV